MKLKLSIIAIASLAFLACKKENSTGCIYGSPKNNSVERIKLIGCGKYTDYIIVKASKKYGDAYFVKSEDCNCPEYLP